MENLLWPESTSNTKVHKKPEISLALMELIAFCCFILLALNLYLSSDLTDFLATKIIMCGIKNSYSIFFCCSRIDVGHLFAISSQIGIFHIHP